MFILAVNYTVPLKTDTTYNYLKPAESNLWPTRLFCVLWPHFYM